MSQDSPYIFAKHDDNGIVHYSLTDTSGRVVCKAFLSGETLAIFAGGTLEVRDRLRGYTPQDLEVLMREVVRG